MFVRSPSIIRREVTIAMALVANDLVADPQGTVGIVQQRKQGHSNPTCLSLLLRGSTARIALG